MKSLTRYLVVITLFALSSLGTVGLNLSMDMENNQMSNCLFMPQDSGQCQMSISDHLTKWQGMFLSVLDSSLILILFTLLSLGLIFSVIRYSSIDPPDVYLVERLKKENSRLKLFDYLQQAMSRGILHAKVYA